MLEQNELSMNNIVDNECFYHADRQDPGGRIFTKEDGETYASLAARGWVDHPWKAGLDPWNRADKTAMHKMQRDCESGLIPKIQDPSKQPGSYEREQLAMQAKKHAQEIAERDERIRELETLSQLSAQSDEKLMDERSDAGLLKETKHKGKPKQVRKPKA